MGATSDIPAGWEDVALAIESEPGVVDASAVVKSMVAKGYRRHRESGEPYDPKALFRRHMHECRKLESMGAGALGMLMRSGVRPLPEHQPPMKEALAFQKGMPVVARLVEDAGAPPKGDISWFTPIREAEGRTPATDGADVVLLTEGAGNLTDGNYYTAEAIQQSARVFEGTKCFLNHPTKSEEDERPERDVRDLCGWYTNTRAQQVELPEGRKWAIVGKLKFNRNAAGKEAKDLVRDAIAYQREYPQGDQVLCGFSVNGAGPTTRGLIEGKNYNMVEAIDWVMSSDLVTFPARGGRAVALREAEQMMDSRLWFAKLREACRRGRDGEARRLLLTRVREATMAPSDAGLVSDVGRGLGAYQGAIEQGQLKLPDGRIGMLTDLEQKATAVESSHNPATIAELLRALTGFLGEEMKEAAAAEQEEKSHATDAKKAETEQKAQQAALHQAQAQLHQQQAELLQHEASLNQEPAKAGAKPAAQGTTAEEGNKMAEKEEEKAAPAQAAAAAPGAEEKAPEEKKEMKEAEKPGNICEACGHAMPGKLAESERQDYMRLKLEEKKNLRLREAQTFIKESKVPDGLMAAEDLASFERSQWPTIVGFALGRVAPDVSLGATETQFASLRESGAPAGRTDESPGDMFNRIWNAGL